MVGCSSEWVLSSSRVIVPVYGNVASTQRQKALSCLSSAHNNKCSENRPMLETIECSGSSCGECKSIRRHGSHEQMIIPPILTTKGAQRNDKGNCTNTCTLVTGQVTLK